MKRLLQWWKAHRQSDYWDFEVVFWPWLLMFLVLVAIALILHPPSVCGQ